MQCFLITRQIHSFEGTHRGSNVSGKRFFNHRARRFLEAGGGEPAGGQQRGAEEARSPQLVSRRKPEEMSKATGNKL